jgi:predicted enzyme related to lactoylglutathione lyase
VAAVEAFSWVAAAWCPQLDRGSLGRCPGFRNRRRNAPLRQSEHAQTSPTAGGIELYFDDLPRAKAFYTDVLGLDLAEEQAGHHAKFTTGTAFVCLEKRGVEAYPSADKAVLFFEVPALARALEKIGSERVAHAELNPPSPWAVLHDPEGHNILLLQASRDRAR